MDKLFQQMPADWQALIQGRLPDSFWLQLDEFLQQEQATHDVYPPKPLVFQALQLTPVQSVKVVILGQDPYHGVGQAHGLAFSVPEGMRLPPSLRNIFKELQNDLRCATPSSGNLTPWAHQGVLLLNSILTVRSQQAASHQKQGWEQLTDQLINALSEKQSHLVFVLWGRFAQQKTPLIDRRHTLISGVHPSPLSASRGFFGSSPFSATNAALEAHGQAQINWCLP